MSQRFRRDDEVGPVRGIFLAVLAGAVVWYALLKAGGKAHEMIKYAIALIGLSVVVSGCGAGTFQVDKTYAAFQYGVVTAQTQQSIKECEKATTELEKRLCARVSMQEKIFDAIAAKALAFDEAAEAFKGKLLQAGMKAASGL